MKAQANAAAASISHERLNAHQQREPRNLGLLANRMRRRCRAQDGNSSRLRIGH